MLIGTGQAEVRTQRVVMAAPPGCKQAVAQSRMVCLTGSNCQREISQILESCSASTAASCADAREEMRQHCRQAAPWYGTRECQAAVQQVGHYCER